MKCIIVDDEFPSREELKYFLTQHLEIEVVGEFDDPIQALKFLQNSNIDVAFLDINMPNLDGMSLGKLITKFKNPPKIVFITAYNSFAVEAFGIHAFDYIMKPYSEDRIKDTIYRLLKTKENVDEIHFPKRNKLTLWKGEKMCVIDVKKVIYCESCERETKIFTKENIFVSKNKISDLEEFLNKRNFYRTHRSYIINVDMISEIIPWFNSTYNLKMVGIDKKIPVSRSKLKEFQGLMGIRK